MSPGCVSASVDVRHPALLHRPAALFPSPERRRLCRRASAPRLTPRVLPFSSRHDATSGATRGLAAEGEAHPRVAGRRDSATPREGVRRDVHGGHREAPGDQPGGAHRVELPQRSHRGVRARAPRCAVRRDRGPRACVRCFSACKTKRRRARGGKPRGRARAHRAMFAETPEELPDVAPQEVVRREGGARRGLRIRTSLVPARDGALDVQISARPGRPELPRLGLPAVRGGAHVHARSRIKRE